MEKSKKMKRRGFIGAGFVGTGLAATPLVTMGKHSAPILTGSGSLNAGLPKFETGARLLFQGDSITDMKWGRNQKDRNHYLGHSFVANLPQVHPVFGRALTVKVRGITVQSIDDKNTEKSRAAFRQWHVFKRMLEGAETVEISNLERGETGFWVWADLYLNGKFIQNLHE